MSLIIGHVDKSMGGKNVERWYGYGQTKYTLDPADHIPIHFIKQYLSRLLCRHQQTARN